MTLQIQYLFAALLTGLGATLIMDAWALLLRHGFKVSSLNYCLVGRWIAHMPEGVFRHPAIGAAAVRPGECAIGWSAHYLTGACFALPLLIPGAGAWFEQPTPGPALALGVATVAFPFLLMQPALGLGIAAAKAPAPGLARLKSLATHAVFGAGLYGSALLLRPLLNAIH